MLLNVEERLLLLSILPKSGRFEFVKELQSLRSELIFSPEDREETHIVGERICAGCRVTNMELANRYLTEKAKKHRVETGKDLPFEELVKLFQVHLTDIIHVCYCPRCQSGFVATGRFFWQKVKQNGHLVELEKEVNISEMMKETIAGILQELDKQEKISTSLVSLYENFCGK